jgi:hypothetical protein
MLLRASVVGLGCVLAVLGAACASPEEVARESTSNLDTSGCSGVDATASQGSVTVRASRPPTNRCWNIPTSGITLVYSWAQPNDSTPEEHDVGFWTSLNGKDAYAKATAYACDAVPAGGLGHSTTGDSTYRCSAAMRFDFERYPKLLEGAYDASGVRLPWQVQVAVSLDEQGTWDSLGGANYRLSL